MPRQIKKNLGATVHHDGVEFRVWAPFAKEVSLMLPFLGVYDGSNVRLMENEQDGYWSLTVNDAEPGMNYKFQIDTGKELLLKNDPRGRIVTSSENGVSVIAPNDFDWGDDLFIPIPKEEQIIYELHIGTFSRKDEGTAGTFYDAIEKLDYLVNLGINMIEIMPVTNMSYGNGWGYNVSELFSIENSYGGRRGMMELVKACHSRGIGVIVDVVYNHFIGSTLWQFDGWSENNRGGIYFYNDERGDTPWGSRLDYGRPEVRQFLLDNVVMWFNEFRVDGLRLDSTIYMRNTAGQDGDIAHDIAEAWQLMQDITTLAHKIRPGALVIAEDSASNTAITKSVADGGCGFDAQWDLHFPHAIRERLGLTTSYHVNLDEQISPSSDNLVFDRIIFSDSHDTAANGNERINEQVAAKQPGSLQVQQRLMLASAITLTSPGIPMLLQGQEFLQEGAFNDWQELAWSNVDKHAGIVLAHQHLIALRRNLYGHTAGLLGDSVQLFHQDTANNVIAYHRWHRGGAGDDTIVIANFNGTPLNNYSLPLPIHGSWRARFNSSWKGYSEEFKEVACDVITTDPDTGLATLSIAPYSVLIFSQDG